MQISSETRKQFIIHAALIAAGVAAVEVVLAVLAGGRPEMVHLLWWREVAEVQAEHGFFNVWTPYPPVFPTLFYVATRIIPADYLETAWLGANFLLMLISALLVFVIAWIITPGERDARLSRGLLAGLAFLMVLWRLAGFVLLGPWLDHFDYLPALLLLLGFLLLILRYEKTSAIVCGIGVMTKIFPFVLVLAAPAVLGFRRSLKYAAIAAATCVAIAAPFAIANWGMFASTWRFAFNRAAWESIWAYLMPAVGIKDPLFNMRAILDPAILAETFHMQYHGGVINNIATFVTVPLMLALPAGTAFLLARRPNHPRETARGVLLMLAIVLLFSKGFSLHFIVWIIPLICIVYTPAAAFALCAGLVLLSNVTAAGFIARNAEMYGPREAVERFAILGPPYFVSWFSIFLRQAVLLIIACQQTQRLLDSREATNDSSWNKRRNGTHGLVSRADGD